jgi:hypothetical protein
MTDTISAPVVASAPPTTTDATAVVLHYSLARFLVDFATPTGTSWRTEIAKLIADPIEYDTLLTLASQFQEQGRFIEPVRVDFDAAVIQNGMHRTATAVLSGHSTIAISQDIPSPYTSVVETEFELVSTPEHLEDPEDILDELCSIIRSFQGTHHWITTDVISVRESRFFTTAYYCHADHEHDLAADLVARVTTYGYTITAPRTSTLDPDEW